MLLLALTFANAFFALVIPAFHTLTAFTSASEPHLGSDRTGSRWVIQEKDGAVEYYSEFDPGLSQLKATLRDVSAELEELTGLRPTGESIQIILFSDHKNYVRYLASSIPEARFRKALFYKNGDVYQVYAYRSRSLMTDIRHELTHAILHQNLKFVPLWIDEGLAELLEETRSQRQTSTRLASVKWKTRVGWSPSLKQLEAISSAADMDEDEYRDSWAWTHFLVNESRDSRQILQEYLKTISRGEAPGPFSKFLAERDATAENRINSYFRKFQFSLSSVKD
ncbi:MAG: hypothetical protein JNL58_15320 [Planctomyces sp.]|nr:hypothetical protein [Planctomyces sp.]